MFTFMDLREIRDDLYYLIIDPRYCIDDSYAEDNELRCAVSYGPNLTIEKAGRILAPPLQEGAYVFGLHEVEISNGNMVRIVDSWLTSYPAVETELSDIKKKAEEILNDEKIEDFFERMLKRGECNGPLKKRVIDNPQFYYG